MKRLILTLAAIASVAGPMAVATEAAAQPRYDRYQRYDGYRGDRGYNRGGYLPPSYSGYYISDYGRYGLRPPPRGYRWHRVGDDYLLAAIASGLIFDIVTR